jgi:ElaB/YqjD/DUF883 family membrane-anchored ribosome-binding protein
MVIKKLRKISLIILAALLFTDIFIVSADDPVVNIFPPKGSITTEIFLQVRDPHMMDGVLYLYWDGLPILRGVNQNIEGGSKNTGYDITFYPPTDSPYSDKGEHILKIEIFYNVHVEQPRLHEEPREYTENLSFVIEDETTNGDVSSDYTELQDKYNSLLEDYDELHQDYLESQNLVAESQNLVAELQDSVVELQDRISELERQLASESNRQIPGFPPSSIAIGVICATMLLYFVWKRV